MTVPTMTWEQVLARNPCAENCAAAQRKLKAKFPDYQTRVFLLADAASAGVPLADLIWIAGMDHSPEATKRIRLFAADCAARVAHIANDPRSTAAIVAARAFARGEIDDAARAAAASAAARAAALAAGDAARDAAWAAALAAAGDAARDAALAAARAAARAAGDAARDAAWAATLAAAWDAGDAARDAAWAADETWQLERLIAWFSENEPTDWPIREAVKEKAA